MKKEDSNLLPDTRVDINHKRKRNRRIRNWIIGILAVVCIAVAGVGLYVSHLYKTAENAANKAYDSKNAVKTTYGEFNGKNSFAVLLLGTDTGAINRTEKMGNTDTIIVALVNPDKKKYTLISIPRDTLADIQDGKDGKNIQKINAAYSVGGAGVAMKTVSKLLNVPIKYYALVNMGGLMKLVTYVGGIYVTPKLTFTYSGFPFKKGVRQHLNGLAALAYSRMRYDDPEGDYGRQKRQREVITKLVKKLTSMNMLTNFNKVTSTLSENVKTNLSFAALRSIISNYSDCTSDSGSDYLHAYSANIGDASYQVASTKELQRISNKIRKELGLKTETVDNTETKLNELNVKNGFSFDSEKTQEYKIYSLKSGSESDSKNLNSASSSSSTNFKSDTKSKSSLSSNSNYEYWNSVSSYETNPFSEKGGK